MPTVPEHLGEAEANIRLYEKLIADVEYPPAWALVVLYYAAVHLARGAATSAGFGPFSSHIAFDSILQKDMKAPYHIYKTYRHLKDDSEKARYDIVSFEAEYVKTLRATEFAKFRTWALAQISRNSPKANGSG